MTQPEGANALKAILLACGNLLACGLAGFVGVFVCVMLTEKRGASYTGSVMMAALGLLGLLFLASLAVLFLLVRRWVRPLWGALGLTLGSGAMLGLMWLAFAFMLAVILNR